MPSANTYNKYKQDLEQIEHHYQNQLAKQASKEVSNKKKKERISYAPNLIQVGKSDLSSHILQNRGSRNISLIILFMAVLFQLAAGISIVVTFIFPFWISFQIDSVQNSSLNITNSESSISLLASNVSLAAGPNPYAIKFDFGLWEIRTYRGLQIGSTLTPSLESMPWPAGNTQLQPDSFVNWLMAFLNMSSSSVFAVQVLEILHFIFAGLTFCATSFTLCLCANRRASVTWYLACLLLCTISLMLGLAVLIILVIWQTGQMPSLVATTTTTAISLSLVKSFGFCFWLAVAIIAGLLLSAVLLIVYTLINAIALHNEKQRFGKKVGHTVRPQSSSILKTSRSFDNLAAKIPRLQILEPDESLVSSSGFKAPINAFNNLESLQPHDANSSYIFYTGHGHFHKQNFTSNEADKSDYEPSTANPIIQPNLANYSITMQDTRNVSRTPRLNEHAYSNVNNVY